MRFLLTFLLLHVVVDPLLGQAVVLLNAYDERTSCIALADSTNPGNTTCGTQSDLYLGKTVRLLVLHRRFLTRYSVEFGETSKATLPHTSGGDDLEILVGTKEISISPSKPLIESKGTLKFLTQLIDETSSSEAVAEIERENQVMRAAERQISQDVQSFNQKYLLIVGDGDSTESPDCEAALRVGFSLRACLHGEFDLISNLSPPNDVAGEQTFGAVVRNVNRLFRDSKSFGEQLKTTDLVDQGDRIASDISRFESDLCTFRSNLDEATNAAWIMRRLLGEPRQSLDLRRQLRMRLALAEHAANSSNWVDNEAETNALIDQSLIISTKEDSIQQSWRDRMEKAIMNARSVDDARSPLEYDLSDIQEKIDVELPTLVSSINDWQLRVAARVNSIYIGSEVPASESDYALTVSNGTVSYRIFRFSDFVPYELKQVEGPITPIEGVEVARGAFAVTENRSSPSRKTLWQILRLSP